MMWMQLPGEELPLLLAESCSLRPCSLLQLHADCASCSVQDNCSMAWLWCLCGGLARRIRQGLAEVANPNASQLPSSLAMCTLHILWRLSSQLMRSVVGGQLQVHGHASPSEASACITAAPLCTLHLNVCAVRGRCRVQLV